MDRSISDWVMFSMLMLALIGFAVGVGSMALPVSVASTMMAAGFSTYIGALVIAIGAFLLAGFGFID